MNKYVLAVIGAGFAWGFMGFFTRNLADFGITQTGSILVRCGVGALCFALLILIQQRPGGAGSSLNQFRIRRRDLWCFLGTGLASLLFFTYCYFTAISLMSLASAAILLYTAPTFVLILSALFFGERFTAKKFLALVLSFLGCALVSGVAGGISISVSGLLYGLGAGFGYSLYTIFSRAALQRGYTASTINFYSCLFASLGVLLIWQPQGQVFAALSRPEAWIWCVVFGVLTCFLPYFLYTYGLTGMENGKAAVVASIEPVVASVLGVVVFHEVLTPAMVVGIALVLVAIAVLNHRPKKVAGTGVTGRGFRRGAP